MKSEKEKALKAGRYYIMTYGFHRDTWVVFVDKVLGNDIRHRRCVKLDKNNKVDPSNIYSSSGVWGHLDKVVDFRLASQEQILWFQDQFDGGFLDNTPMPLHGFINYSYSVF